MAPSHVQACAGMGRQSWSAGGGEVGDRVGDRGRDRGSVGGVRGRGPSGPGPSPRVRGRAELTS